MTGEAPPPKPVAPKAPPAPPKPQQPTQTPASVEAVAAGAAGDVSGFEAPSQVMDQDELDAKITVNVESVFSEIFMVKVLGSLFFVLAGVLAFLPPILAGEEIVDVLPSMVLGIVGMVLGIVGFFVRSMRKWMMIVAPVLLIAAVAARPLTSSIGSLDLMEIILGLAFAVTWFLAIEYLHALSRFVEVGEMAIKRRLTNFNLSGVVKHFLAWGFLMLAICVGLTLGVFGLVIIIIAALLFADGDGGGIGDSAELWSVYGIALASAIVFTLMALVLTVWYTFAETTAKVEKVEYSREKLQEMLASGQVLDLEQEAPFRTGSEQV
jgi:hypothetical protein